MLERQKILHIQTSGVDTPERAYAPFILATTAAMMNIDATVYFLIKSVTLVKKEETEKIKIGGFPSLRKVMSQAVKAGVKKVVCEQSCKLWEIPREDFVPGAKIVDAANLNDSVLNSDSVICF